MQTALHGIPAPVKEFMHITMQHGTSSKTMNYTQKLRPVSHQAQADLLGKQKRVFFSKGTIDKPDCMCKKAEHDLKVKLTQLSPAERHSYLTHFEPIACPLSVGKLKFKLHCPACNEPVAEVHADSEKLDNWCNLHYISWYNKHSWYGTYGVNMNPYTLEVTFECCCKEVTELNSLIVQET